MKNFIKYLVNKKSFYLSIGIISLVLIWLILSSNIDNEIILPKLSSIFKSLWDIITNPANLSIILSTLIRLISSTLIAFIISFLLLILSIYYDPLVSFFKPLLNIFKTVPVASIIIIVLIWFGSKKSPIVISTIVIIPIMTESFLTGLKNIDKAYLEELKICGGTNLYAIAKVYLPLIQPFIFVAIIQSLGLGIKVTVMSELISQTNNSIGNQIYINKVYLDMPGLFAWTLILVVLVVLLELLINYSKQKLLISN